MKRYVSDEIAEEVSDLPKGLELLHDPVLNKGTAFTKEERRAFGLEGLLPPNIHTQDEQVMRVMENYRRKRNDLERYIHLIALQDRNETLFYRVLQDHINEMMPVVYTPVVGLACQEYGHIFRRARGLFLTPGNRGHFADILRNWPYHNVRVIVVTDGERILGLGDLGADGMGIPVGKLTLYTTCAGVHPQLCLPVVLDVGTNNEDLLSDPLYIGTRQRRIRGAEYDEIVEEFIEACGEVFPEALIQLEDFGVSNAFSLLERYSDQVCVFDDDIQGTGAVVLGGILSALRLTRSRLRDQKFLFVGAGQAGIGIANTLVSAMVREGLGETQARGRCWLFDSTGLVVESRVGVDLQIQKVPFAHELAMEKDLLSAVRALEPTVLIGASGQPDVFTPGVISEMAAFNEKPMIFALSNPTWKSECTAEAAYRYSEGRCIFASGSPFESVSFDDRLLVPGQANNAYIFPGVGLGVVASRSRLVTEEMFRAAAEALAGEVTWDDLERGCIYPRLHRIRQVSLSIATAVAEIAYSRKLAGNPRPGDVRSYITQMVYEPVYRSCLQS